MKSKKKGIKQRIANGVKRIDIFGHPITLNYNKQPQYRSMIGGITTILVISGLSIYFAVLLQQTLTLQSYQVLSDMSKRNVAIDNSR